MLVHRYLFFSRAAKKYTLQSTSFPQLSSSYLTRHTFYHGSRKYIPVLRQESETAPATFYRLSSHTSLNDGDNSTEFQRPERKCFIISATSQFAAGSILVDGKDRLRRWHQLRCVTLIDTPGFDDDVRGNIAILLDIASDLLRLAISGGSPLQGIIFLHDISETRFSGSQRKTLSILQQICGAKAMGNVIIGTTMWLPDNNKKFNQQKAREAEILKEHWDGIHSTVRLFEDDFDAAASIVARLLSVPRVNLLVQDEMCPNGIVCLGETTVGKTVLADGSDESERLRRQGNVKEAGALDSLLNKLRNPADMTFAEKLGLAIAAPIVLAPVALVSAPVGAIYALVHGANHLPGNSQ